MRHAQEHWLRLQAEEALKLAADVEPLDMELAIEKAPLEILQVVLGAYREKAARSLVNAELIHRELVRRGEKV